MSSAGSFSHPRLIVCEGPDDKWFFSKLIERRSLPNFHIETTRTKKGKSGGNSQFGRKLRILKNIRRNFGFLESVLIVSDNDANQSDSFASICDQLKDNGFDVPDGILKPTKARPYIKIMMLPLSDAPGNLESVCIEATRSTNKKNGAHVDTFCATVGAESWRAQQSDKLWLRSALAANYQKDPFVFLGRAFREGLVPMDHSSFDDIAAVLDGMR